MAHSHDKDEGTSESTAYETRDVKVRPLVQFIVGLTIVAAVTYLVVFGLLRMWTAGADRQDALVQPATAVAAPAKPGEERLPPEPRIQANPAADLKTLVEEERAILTTYGWVDRQAGVARVPIEVAMQRVLEQGLPVRQPESAPPATGAPASPAAPKGADKTVKASK
jgi:hypothetical protein